MSKIQIENQVLLQNTQIHHQQNHKYLQNAESLVGTGILRRISKVGDWAMPLGRLNEFSLGASA
jgi:hypothetical protein